MGALDKYKLGFDHGYQDGVKNIKRRPNYRLPKLSAVISGKVVQTYLKGYSDGYLSGSRDKNRRR